MHRHRLRVHWHPVHQSPESGSTARKLDGTGCLRLLFARGAHPLSWRAIEASLEKATEITRRCITQLLRDHLHGENSALKQRQTDVRSNIIDHVRKTAGKLPVVSALQGALIAVHAIGYVLEIAVTRC